MADSAWTLSTNQTTRLQSLRKVALKYAGGTGFNQFRELLRHVDATIVPPRVVAPPPLSTPLVPTPVSTSPVASVPPTKEGPNDVASRKRLRKELESADTLHQSTLPSDERSIKRQKIVQPQPDIFSRIIKHRPPMLPPTPIAASVTSRVERGPDGPMIEVANPEKEVLIDMSPVTVGFSIKGAAVATGISIKGAAVTTAKAAGKGNPPLQPPQGTLPAKAPSSQLSRLTAVNHEPSISSVIQTLRIQPTPSSSINPMDGTRPRVSPQSPPEIQDSLNRLLLGKPREQLPPQAPGAQPLLKSLPGSSLLERIQGAKVSLPSNQPQAPAPTIFDRLGIPPKTVGGNAGPRNNGPRKRGM
jgi:hypothetical protein